MATTIRAHEVRGDADQPCAWPTLESIEEAVRTARRAMSTARTTTEDFVDQASLTVRRHPLIAVGVAAGAGLVTGCVFGFVGAWFARRRTA